MPSAHSYTARRKPLHPADAPVAMTIGTATHDEGPLANEKGLSTEPDREKAHLSGIDSADRTGDVGARLDDLGAGRECTNASSACIVATDGGPLDGVAEDVAW